MSPEEAAAAASQPPGSASMRSRRGSPPPGAALPPPGEASSAEETLRRVRADPGGGGPRAPAPGPGPAAAPPPPGFPELPTDAYGSPYPHGQRPPSGRGVGNGGDGAAAGTVPGASSVAAFGYPTGAAPGAARPSPGTASVRQPYGPGSPPQAQAPQPPFPGAPRPGAPGGAAAGYGPAGAPGGGSMAGRAAPGPASAAHHAARPGHGPPPGPAGPPGAPGYPGPGYPAPPPGYPQAGAPPAPAPYPVPGYPAPPPGYPAAPPPPGYPAAPPPPGYPAAPPPPGYPAAPSPPGYPAGAPVPGYPGAGPYPGYPPPGAQPGPAPYGAPPPSAPAKGAPKPLKGGRASGGGLRKAAKGRPVEESALDFGPPPQRVRTPRRVAPFDASKLEKVSREAVRLSKLVAEAYPGYFFSDELRNAVQAFLLETLGPESAATRVLTVEVKRKDDGSVQAYDFTEDEITIGTHRSNLLTVTGAQVSRRHCRITYDERGYCLVDQGSSNGTFLRGERIVAGQPYVLKNGEMFTIPGYEVVIRWPTGETAPRLKAIGHTALRVQGAAAFLAEAPALGYTACLRGEPGGLAVLIESDLPLVSLVVSRLLGDAIVVPRPLAEVEEGVLEYFLVRLVDAANRAWGPKAELTFRLESVRLAKDPGLAEVAAGGALLATSVTLDFDASREAVRVALPQPSVAAVAERIEAGGRAGQAPEDRLARLSDLIGDIRIDIHGVIGETKVTRGEAAQIAPGDILVPEELSVRPEEGEDGGGLSGTVDLVLTTGAGQKSRKSSARIRGRLVQFGERVQLELVDFMKGNPNAEVATVHEREGDEEEEGSGEAGESSEAGGVPEGTGVLDDVPLPLVIELGRLSLTVREIAALRRGQVIELHRHPSEPVSLVIDGRVVGSGKLVSVEGEIGVQITSIEK